MADRAGLNRRTLIGAGTGGGALAGSLVFSRLLAQDTATPEPTHAGHETAEGHSPNMAVGDVDIEGLGWDPSDYLTTFDYGAATTMQDDKMMAMGRLAAGLAHELNNPASAAARSAKLLHDAMIESRNAWRDLCATSLSDEERWTVDIATCLGGRLGEILECGNDERALEAVPLPT